MLIDKQVIEAITSALKANRTHQRISAAAVKALDELSEVQAGVVGLCNHGATQEMLKSLTKMAHNQRQA